MDIGQKIRIWRNERGMTQLMLAEKANISRSYLAGVETGKYNPSLDTLSSISSALGITSSQLLDGRETSGRTIVSVYNDPFDYVPDYAVHLDSIAIDTGTFNALTKFARNNKRSLQEEIEYRLHQSIVEDAERE